jgi:hypothetical protein
MLGCWLVCICTKGVELKKIKKKKKPTKEKAMSSDVQEEAVVSDVQDVVVVSSVSGKKPRPNNKTTWLLAYGAGGPSISFELLTAKTVLIVDECYTAVDRANKYMLIHLARKVRETGIQKAMKILEKEMGIVLSGVYGYDSINSNTASDRDIVKEHVLYRWMERSFKQRQPTFECWISPHKKSRGLFGYLMESSKEAGKTDMMKWKKRKLARLLFEAEEKVKKLLSEVSVLSAKLDETEQKFKLLGV